MKLQINTYNLYKFWRFYNSLHLNIIKHNTYLNNVWKLQMLFSITYDDRYLKL